MTYPWEEDDEAPEASQNTASVTYKCGPGFDAPWIVIKGPDVDYLREQTWKLSQASREALENGDIFLGVALAGAEFSGKAGVVGLTTDRYEKKSSVAQYAAKSEPAAPSGGYTNSAGTAQAGQVQQAGPGVPQWAVGLEIPIGDKSGQPMTPKEGTSKKTGKYYAMWSDPRPWSVLQNLDKSLHDTVVSPPGK